VIQGPERWSRSERARLLRPGRNAVLGALIGTGSAIFSTLLAGFFTELLPFTGLLILMVALVGLGLGAAAAAYAYGAASLVVVILTIVPHDQSTIGLDDGVRLLSFILGSPLVVFMALRAEREIRATARALETTAVAERHAQGERAAAERAHRDLNIALRAADRERARLEEVAEAIPEPLMVYDGDGVGTYGNRAALRVFGRSFFERGLDEWAEVAEPRDEGGNRLPRDEWPQLAAQHGPLRRRLSVRLPMSGRDLIVAVEGTPIPGGGCVLLMRDVGKEEDERRRLSRFASFVAHELRNPLAVAKARIELSQRDPNPANGVAHSRRALESVDAAIGILERLELFSRADAGQVQARQEPFELAAALESALERLRARGSERQVTFRMRGRPLAVGDRHFAEQAITNLLINADRYSTPGAPIRVEVATGDPIAVRIIDEGPGIADETAEHLFRDRVTAGRGLGLGLYLVNALMQAQGGTVELEQRRPKAIFTLRWRRAQRGRASTSV
jgi:signal transduction histidine kinase